MAFWRSSAFAWGFDRSFAEPVYHLFSRPSRNGLQKLHYFGEGHAQHSHFQSRSHRGRQFAAADRGNIAVLFAIALVPILSFVGAAVDYTRANAARTSMQAALDSTALMLSKDLSDGTIKTSRDQYQGAGLLHRAL